MDVDAQSDKQKDHLHFEMASNGEANLEIGKMEKISNHTGVLDSASTGDMSNILDMP